MDAAVPGPREARHDVAGPLVPPVRDADVPAALQRRPADRAPAPLTRIRRFHADQDAHRFSPSLQEETPSLAADLLIRADLPHAIFWSWMFLPRRGGGKYLPIRGNEPRSIRGAGQPVRHATQPRLRDAPARWRRPSPRPAGRRLLPVRGRSAPPEGATDPAADGLVCRPVARPGRHCGGAGGRPPDVRLSGGFVRS